MRAHTSVLARTALVPALLGALVLSVLVAAPAQAQRIKPDYFGMHAFHWHDSFTPSVEVGSANFTTSGTYWMHVQTTKRRFKFARLTQQIEAAEKLGAQPMIVLGKTPKFYSPKPRADDFHAYAPPMKAWKRWVSKVAKKYGPRLDYQIWPEPNIVQNWKGTPAQLAKLTAAASRIIKGVSRKAKVVGPAMTLRLKGQRTQMMKYYKQSVNGKRVHKYLNAIAIDTFPVLEGTPEDSYALILKAKKMLARSGVRKIAFWNNEINYGVQGGGDASDYSLPVATQQAYVVRTYALSAAARMARTYWLGWFSTQTMAVDMAEYDSETQSFKPLPPATGYRTVRNWLVGTDFKGCSKNASGLWTCVAVTAAETRKIYWHPSATKGIARPSGTLRVENQSGGDMGVKDSYPVDYRPIMIATAR